VKVFTPVKFNVPVPVLEIPKFAPEITELIFAVPVMLKGVAALFNAMLPAPEMVGVPSSTVNPPIVCAPLKVTV
jgi:hypothetical protein